MAPLIFGVVIISSFVGSLGFIQPLHSLSTLRPLSKRHLPQQPNHGGFQSNAYQQYHRNSPRFSRSTILMATDYYKDLGIPRTAGLPEIKKAYKKMSRTCHPDIVPDKLEEWHKVSRAYEVLSDVKTKQAYDAYGEAGVSQAEAGGGGPGGGGGFNSQVDLSDIFESFFGGGGGGGGGFGGFHQQEGFGARRGAGKSGRVASVGDDLQIDLEISFKTACFGGKEKMTIRHLEVCEMCDGSRMKPGTRKRTCGTCDGHGVVLTSQQTALGTFRSEAQCSKCKGLGEIIEKICPSCYGKGNVQKVKELSVDVPCGCDSGNRILIKGEGNAGSDGGASGDLHVVLKVKPDKVFRRVGVDVHSTVNVPYLDAILGSEAVVKTIDGEVTIKIPAGSQPETILRLKNRGAPRLNQRDHRGSHFVTLKVTIPKQLSGKERSLLEQLKSC